MNPAVQINAKIKPTASEVKKTSMDSKYRTAFSLNLTQGILTAPNKSLISPCIRGIPDFSSSSFPMRAASSTGARCAIS